MKKKSKALLLGVCAVLLVVFSIMGTMAYLTSTDTVTNTFTVGNVAIKLDEAKANADGTLVANADRVKENTYKLLPGHLYHKDPMVTVEKGSEESYIKMTVTVSKCKELDEIGVNLTDVFDGYESEKWIYKGNTKDKTANTRTYEFWYHITVTALEEEKMLEPLFTMITVPGSITNAQLATIEGMTIKVDAYAIQADGFKTAKDAWSTYSSSSAND